MSRLFKVILSYILFIFFVTITFANNNNNWKLSYMEYNLAKCYSRLLDDEKLNRIRNIRISVKTESSLGRYISGDIIDQIRRTTQKSAVVYEIFPTSTKISIYEIHTRLLIVDSYESFRDLLKLQRKISRDTHGLRQYYYIILMNYKEGTNTIHKILDLCLQNYIVNVNLIVENSQGINTIYTYFPFTETSCRKSEAIIYNRFAEGKFQWNRPVFPRKMKNLWLCPVRAITWHKPPFVFLEDQKVSGIDGNFLIFLSKAMNFTLDVFESPQGLGEVFPNGTTRGAFKIIQDKKGDLMVGGTICSKLRRTHLACTRNYFTTAVQIVLKKPSPYSSLEILLFPFDSYTWVTLCLFLFINLTIRGLWRKIGKRFDDSGILSTRLQTISYLLSVFIIRSSYEGSIFKFLHNQPIRRAPQNFEEALDEGYKFLAKSTYFPFIKHIPVLVDNLILSEVPLGKLFDEFDKFKGKYALINLDNYLTAIADDTTRYGHYVDVREPILHNIICAYLPKFSFFTEEINRLIEIMINDGHIQKIFDISVTDKLRKIKSLEENVVHTIPLNEIIGAFELLLFFMGIGFLCLLMEILAMKIVIVKKIVDFLHC